MKPSNILCIEGTTPGPTLAIFAGVHGNEKAGVYALENLLPELGVTRGTLFVAFANPPAIASNVRMINKNLNRCFSADNNGNSTEDKRARQLMQILDTCDALLDLHMFYDDDGEPFVICEDFALELAKIFDVNIISTNWTEVEPGGTDGYMYTKGKLGICLECGPISKAKEYAPYAEEAIYQFLKFFNMTDISVEFSQSKKRVIRAKEAVFKSSNSFVLGEGFKNFQRLEANQLIASDNKQQYTAKAGECIIFPHYNARIDEEAYIIGEELDR